MAASSMPNNPNRGPKGLSSNQAKSSNKPGRPAEMLGGKRRNPYLSDADWGLAKKIGGGSASEGIRKALEIAKNEVAP